MFVVRDKRSGKFLRKFSGSYSHAHWWALGKLKLYKEGPDSKNVHSFLWSLDTPNQAKVYTTIAGIKNSLSNCVHNKENRKREYYLPEWVEIVSVTINNNS